MNPGGSSSAAEAIALSTHVGHPYRRLVPLLARWESLRRPPLESIQNYSSGIAALSVDTIQPIFRRGVLLDIAGLTEDGPLPPDFEITPDHLNLGACRGLSRRGRCGSAENRLGRLLGQPRAFHHQLHCPGPGLEAARWLSRRGIFAAGSDTAPFEFMPSPAMNVHVHLLVESGIHIIECLNLEELAAARRRGISVYRSPLRIRGGTGSPIRPIALVPDE